MMLAKEKRRLDAERRRKPMAEAMRWLLYLLRGMILLIPMAIIPRGRKIPIRTEKEDSSDMK